MNGKIDENGCLYIMRGNIMKKQDCVYDEDRRCCDYCSHFGEPEPEESYDITGGGYKETGKTDLSLCHRLLTFDNFTDERK